MTTEESLGWFTDEVRASASVCLWGVRGRKIHGGGAVCWWWWWRRRRRQVRTMSALYGLTTVVVATDDAAALEQAGLPPRLLSPSFSPLPSLSADVSSLPVVGMQSRWSCGQAR
jgi:hypothetical protein